MPIGGLHMNACPPNKLLEHGRALPLDVSEHPTTCADEFIQLPMLLTSPDKTPRSVTVYFCAAPREPRLKKQITTANLRARFMAGTSGCEVYAQRYTGTSA